MDDATLAWLRLALCPKTPNSLKRELSNPSSCSARQLSLPLGQWLNGPGSSSSSHTPAPKGLNLPDAFQHQPDAWRKLHKLLNASSVDAALDTTRAWESESPNRFVLTPSHPLWPKRLNALDDPPLALFAIGAPEIAQWQQIAVVGARRASPDGKATAYALSKDLSAQGWVITSGLALGIDAQAHTGCLASGTPTLSVMANDPTGCYPRANRSLAEKIVTEGGCLITETPIGMPLERFRFPRRNRLIAALSEGVIVVEAALKSGTITTANHAAAQGREVMAVPGSARNPRVAGCHQLIRDGAALVTDAKDVVACLGQCGNDLVRLGTRKSPSTVAASENVESTMAVMQGTDSKRVTTLLDAIGYDSAPLERLALHTGLSAAELVTLLTQLELQGRVSRDLAGRYSRC